MGRHTEQFYKNLTDPATIRRNCLVGSVCLRRSGACKCEGDEHPRQHDDERDRYALGLG